MALIKCILLRTGGTKIEFANKKYHFRPDPKDTSEHPEHVCEIADPATIHRLLRIKEAYALVDPDEVLPEAPRREPGQTIAGNGPEAVVAKPIIVSDGETDYNLSEMALEDLRQVAINTFGIKPHHKWNAKTIIDKIIEKTRAED